MNNSSIAKNNQIFDIIIIGGGVIGLLSAILLQNHGIKVLVLEKDRIGRESSWAGGGILSPLYPWNYADAINTLASYGQQHYPEFCQMLYTETGIDPEYVESGIFMADLQGHENTVKEWLEKFNHNCEWVISGSRCKQIETEINDSLSSGLWMPDIAQVRNPRLMKSLKVLAKKLNIQIREQYPVEDILVKAGRAIGIRSGTEEILAESVIVASGAWSGKFSLLKKITIKPVLGQMIQYKTEPGKIKAIIMQGGKYIIPRADGRVICGSTLEMTEYHKRTTEQVKQELHKAAITMIPSLAKQPIVDHWCGLRPGSPNGVPYVGEYPEIDNLYINTGHYRYGVVMGLGSAQLITDMICGTKSFTEPEAYGILQQRNPSKEFR